MNLKSDKQIILEHIEPDMVVGDDGYYYYWPTTPGAFSEYTLRVIADELKARNEKWDKRIEEYFETQKSERSEP